MPAWTIDGKTCLVTGVTQGIGRVTARELARRGAHVILVARNAATGAETLDEVRRLGSAELHLADLASQAEIRRLAAEVLARHERLHVLVNNAGAIHGSPRLSPDGIELTFAVNHLAPFLLTELLRTRLVASAPARIVTVASDSHKRGRLDWDDLGQASRYRAYRAYRAYAASKLANVLHTYELARRLEGTGVTANCLHPGVVRTGFARSDGGLVGVTFRLLGRFFLTPEEGARTVIHLAASPEVEGVTGRYFVRGAPRRSSPASRDRDAQARLWRVSEALCGLGAA